MKRSRRNEALFLVAIWFAAALTAVGSVHAGVRRNGKIVFSSDRNITRGLFLMNPDGTNQTRLTWDNFFSHHPVWSPDGKRIAYLSQNVPSGMGIFVIDPQANVRTFITPVNYVIPSTGSGLIWDGWSMSWSPDGQRIVFSDLDSIVIVNANGTNRRTLVSGLLPAWSPDGTRILFLRRTAGFGSTVHTIRPDGSDLRTITPTLPDFYAVMPAAPVWSPDGTKIALLGSDSANHGIFIANSDGTNPEVFEERCVGAVPNGCSVVNQPAWSPDGTKMTFTNGVGGPAWVAIYSRDFGQTDARQLTTSSGLSLTPNWQPLPKAGSDFDGDGRTDPSVFRSSEGDWHLDRSADGYAAVRFGLPNDRTVPADYDGDGKTDIAVFRDGAWWWLNSSDQTVAAVNFGLPGDIPVPADYDGNGRDEIAVFRGGEWWARDPVTGNSTYLRFGLAADKAVPADYDGDGRVDRAVYRNGAWHFNGSLRGYNVLNFGLASDRPVVGDFDGDLKSDLAVYRDGTWYLQQSTAGFETFNWGLATDVPVPGDYDGDGRTDAAVFRGGIWYLRQSTSGVSIEQFGLPSDVPVHQLN